MFCESIRVFDEIDDEFSDSTIKKLIPLLVSHAYPRSLGQAEERPDAARRPGVGHMLPSLLMHESLEYLADRAYHEAPGDASAVGIYFMRKPMLVLCDPDLVKQVLQSDFASFHHNGREINPKADAIQAKNPFFIHDLQAWRESRARVVGHLSDDGVHRAATRRVEGARVRGRAEETFRALHRRDGGQLGLRGRGSVILGRARSRLVSRGGGGSLRAGLCQRLETSRGVLPARARGLRRHVYETSSLILAFFVYQLARNSEEQHKIRRHVRDVSGGKLTYESLKAMSYLEQAVYESLRLIPPAPALYKRCSRETTLMGEDGYECRMRPGDGVMLPIMGLQNDPRYWDEPDNYHRSFGPTGSAPSATDICSWRSARARPVLPRFLIMAERRCLFFWFSFWNYSYTLRLCITVIFTRLMRIYNQERTRTALCAASAAACLPTRCAVADARLTGRLELGCAAPAIWNVPCTAPHPCII
ncbi:unnamed protein product [Trichogramma brassicae]|uniref:Cytochrome P450 n=1 Tax=Trichogramma brassicae TaxID=86971 RepID=A0A6H5IKV7_9HYME|nr:unnamed protein product [Trichogramma brassicae]